MGARSKKRVRVKTTAKKAEAQLDREIAKVLAQPSGKRIVPPKAEKKDSLFVDARVFSPTLRESALGITPEIKAAVINYERQLGGPAATAGLAARVINAIYNNGGVKRLRSMTKRDLLRSKNLGRRTVKAMIDLGLSSEDV